MSAPAASHVERGTLRRLTRQDATVRDWPIARAIDINDKDGMESQADPVERQSDETPARRLVVRIKLPAQAAPVTPARSGFNRGLLLLIAAPVVALLIWIGASMMKTDRAPREAATAVREEALAKPVAVAPEVKPTQPAVREQPAVPLTPVNRVIPEVARSARDTIRGTIRVSIGVTIDQQGAVVATTAEESGPSRYFLRLSDEAAKKWTFTPANAAGQRSALLRFYFRRSGATASMESPQ